jgi:hypothetical protein
MLDDYKRLTASPFLVMMDTLIKCACCGDQISTQEDVLWTLGRAVCSVECGTEYENGYADHLRDMYKYDCADQDLQDLQESDDY